MNYRVTEKAGITVSEIGLGCEGFADKNEKEVLNMLKCAAEAGINCMDLYYPDPRLRSSIGQALKRLDKPFVIQGHLCTVWKNGQYKRTRDLKEVRASFEDLLERLRRSMVEIGMIHYVDAMEDWNVVKTNGILEYALKLKGEGKIKALGLSSHNPKVALEAVNSGVVDVLMFSINPCYDLLPGDENCEALWDEKNYENDLVNMDPERALLYETCQRNGVGITVMKAFGGGDLLDASLSPAGVALSASQCIHYALTRPGVVSVLSGAHSKEEILSSVAYEDASEAERDYIPAFIKMPRIHWKGHCMYCGHCAPCPKEIDVAMVTKLLNLARTQKEIPETVREHYALLKHPAEECIACGACETRCPFGVPVINNMKEATEVFKARG